MTESDNQNTVSKWPYDGQKEKLTATVQAEIVKNLALYANQAAYRRPEEVGMSGSLDAVFLGYCFVAKEYFRKKAKTTPQASKIVDEAIQQIDRLYRWVSKPDDSFMVLLNEWDSLWQRFEICVGSVQQKAEQVQKPEEAKQNATPAKHWKIIAWTKEFYGLTIERITKAYLDKYG